MVLRAGRIALASIAVVAAALAGCGGGESSPEASGSPLDQPASTADALLQYDNALNGAKASNPLAQQLQIVARMIAARGALGARRQVFFVSLGGFDTHDQQHRNHADLMARLSQPLAYFGATLGGLGVRDQVTTFTISDFGRTFPSNGDGTDHGWSAHHVVRGDAVRGRNLYGNFPAYGVADSRGEFSSANQIDNGSMLPERSVHQCRATLGRWFGLSDALLDVFARLARFDASKRNLGFML